MTGLVAEPRKVLYESPQVIVWERVIFGRVHVFAFHLLNGKPVVVFVDRQNMTLGGWDRTVRTIKLHQIN